jgi:nitrite reductase/ring-hydroxylating ferredoxin subunit
MSAGAGKQTRVAGAGEIGEGEARVVEVGDRTLAVFNVGGTFYAIDNTCPHRGGPLGEGDVDGRIVVCPWHAWRWDVTTGSNANNPAVKVACYPVSAGPDGVFVEVG